MSKSNRWGKSHESVIRDHMLSARDLRVYGALSVHADKQGRCYAKRGTISEMTGIHTSNITKATNHLMARGHLAKYGNGGRSRPAHYLLTAYGNSVTTDTLSEPKRVSDGTRFQQPEKSRKGVTTDTRKEQSIKGPAPTSFSLKQERKKAAAAGPFLLQVLDLYHEHLPQLPRAVVPTAEMEADLLDLQNRHPKASDLEWWPNYFWNVGLCDYLLGKKGFLANLQWLLKFENFAKVANGKYLDGEGAKDQDDDLMKVAI